MKRLQYILIITIAFFIAASGRLSAKETYTVVVTDASTGEPIISAITIIKGASRGTTTNEDGIAIINAVPGNNIVKVSMIGYQTAERDLSLGGDTIRIPLKEQSIELNEVVVKKKRQHYSKRNNPAVELMRNIRAKAKLNDPKQKDYHNYDVYERITLGITRNSNDTLAKSSGKFGFLNEYTDSSTIPSVPILNISLKEKLATRHYRKDPTSQKETVKAIRRIGLDDFIDQASMQVFLDDILHEVDLYNNDIAILRSRFVSPLSYIGADFYKYYLTDTVVVDGTECVELSFVPRTSESFGFTGKMYVVTSDSSYFVKKVNISIPKDININFVDKFYLNQTFEMDSLGIRQLKNEDVSGVFKIFDGMQGVYARRNSNYYNHDYAESASPEIFSSLSNTITPEIAYERTDNYWQENRPVELSDAENRVGEMITRLRKNKTYHWLETITKIIVDGYIPTASPDSKSKFNIGPWNTTISGNEIEGIRLRVGGLTTAALSKRIFARGYIAYGTKDHRFKYSAELEYSFRNKQKHAKEFPMHSIALSQEYDVDKLGQHYLFTSSNNFVLSVTRIKNKLMTYLSTTKLEYTLELENNFSVVASLNRQRQSVGPYLPFVTSNGVSHNHFDVSSFIIQLRYAPGEKFYQTNSERIPLSQDAPIILISHQYGPDGYFGNNFGINKTEVSFHKRFWLSAFGYIDGIVKGGWIWNQVPYPLLLMPNANLSYTIQPESFSLMTPMEFMSDRYASVFVSYFTNGAIFNHIPLIKKLKLREVFSFRGYLGSLRNENIPAENNDLYMFPASAHATRMRGKPYMEVSAGIDNILKLFRVDYVWRLNYRDTPDVDKSGLRISLHVAM